MPPVAPRPLCTQHPIPTSPLTAYLVPVWRCCVLNKPTPVLLVCTADEGVHIKPVFSTPWHFQLLNTSQLRNTHNRQRRAKGGVSQTQGRMCLVVATRAT